jgi:hypothetical protein
MYYIIDVEIKIKNISATTTGQVARKDDIQ